MLEKIHNDIADGNNQKKHIEYLLNDLVETLNNEVRQYHILINTLIEQRIFFSKGDITSFEEINKRQGTIVLKIKTLEEARKSIISQLSHNFNIPKDELTITRLATIIYEPYNEYLLALSNDIVTIIKNLESIRESNAYLIQHALHYINGVLRIFASPDTRNLKYTNNGQLEHEKEKGNLMSSWG